MKRKREFFSPWLSLLVQSGCGIAYFWDPRRTRGVLGNRRRHRGQIFLKGRLKYVWLTHFAFFRNRVEIQRTAKKAYVLWQQEKVVVCAPQPFHFSHKPLNTYAAQQDHILEHVEIYKLYLNGREGWTVTNIKSSTASFICPAKSVIDSSPPAPHSPFSHFISSWYLVSHKFPVFAQTMQTWFGFSACAGMW